MYQSVHKKMMSRVILPTLWFVGFVCLVCLFLLIGMSTRWKAAPVRYFRVSPPHRRFLSPYVVYENDDEFPNTVEIVPEYDRYIDDLIEQGRLFMEDATVDSWGSEGGRSYLEYMGDSIRNQPIKLKTFEDAVVYRKDEVTYFHTSRGLVSYSKRCNNVRARPFRMCPDPRDRVTEAVLLHSEIWGGGYYHMMHEKVIMVSVARDIIVKNPGVMVLVEKIYPTMVEAFSLVDISVSSIREYNGALFVEKLHVPYLGVCGMQAGEMQRRFRQWVHDIHPPQTNKYTGKVVLIDRAENGCRRCLDNTGEIINTLRPEFSSVERVVLGRMPVHEQMRLFQEADVVIGPHGAGLTNIVFMRENTCVIEIHNERNYLNNAYSDMAVNLDLHYRGLIPAVRQGTIDWRRADVDKVLMHAKQCSFRMKMKSTAILRPHGVNTSYGKRVDSVFSSVYPVLGRGEGKQSDYLFGARYMNSTHVYSKNSGRLVELPLWSSIVSDNPAHVARQLRYRKYRRKKERRVNWAVLVPVSSTMTLSVFEFFMLVVPYLEFENVYIVLESLHAQSREFQAWMGILQIPSTMFVDPFDDKRMLMFETLTVLNPDFVYSDKNIMGMRDRIQQVHRDQYLYSEQNTVTIMLSPSFRDLDKVANEALDVDAEFTILPVDVDVTRVFNAIVDSVGVVMTSSQGVYPLFFVQEGGVVVNVEKEPNLASYVANVTGLVYRGVPMKRLNRGVVHESFVARREVALVLVEALQF